jgi:hypothetical protein
MMIGMKRPYPFSLDFSQAPALNYKLPPNAEIGTNSRRTSCESESGFHFVAGNSTSRFFQLLYHLSRFDVIIVPLE